MATVNQNMQSGNLVKALFDGREIGTIQSVEMDDDYGLEPASGIGDPRPVEHVPGMARHSLQVSSMMFKRRSMRSAGVAPENVDGVMQGLVIDIVVYDRVSGEPIRTYHGCSYASGRTSVAKHTIVMESGTFLAIDVTGATI